MRPSHRRGVSGYIEVFILVGVAIGGTGIVFGAALGWLGASSGPAAEIVSASIRQGTWSAVETVTVSDVGTSPLGALTIITTQPPASGAYCYLIEAPLNGSLLASTCPTTAGNPGEVSLPADVKAGESITVELLISGGSFQVGSSHQVSVATASGAEAAAYVQVEPA